MKPLIIASLFAVAALAQSPVTYTATVTVTVDPAVDAVLQSLLNKPVGPLTGPQKAAPGVGGRVRMIGVPPGCPCATVAELLAALVVQDVARLQVPTAQKAALQAKADAARKAYLDAQKAADSADPGITVKPK